LFVLEALQHRALAALSRPIDPVFWPDSIVLAISARKTGICGWSTSGSDAGKAVLLGEVRGAWPALLQGDLLTNWLAIDHSHLLPWRASLWLRLNRLCHRRRRFRARSGSRWRNGLCRRWRQICGGNLSRWRCRLCNAVKFPATTAARARVIAGHKTSVSLEDAFWEGLKEIASGRHASLSDLVAAIDSERQHVWSSKNNSGALQKPHTDGLHRLGQEISDAAGQCRRRASRGWPRARPLRHSDPATDW
jgi:predicted DNA-binding ribbon-helix-helix protein